MEVVLLNTLDNLWLITIVQSISPISIIPVKAKAPNKHPFIPLSVKEFSPKMT